MSIWLRFVRLCFHSSGYVLFFFLPIYLLRNIYQLPKKALFLVINLSAVLCHTFWSTSRQKRHVAAAASSGELLPDSVIRSRFRTLPAQIIAAGAGKTADQFQAAHKVPLMYVRADVPPAGMWSISEVSRPAFLSSCVTQMIVRQPLPEP